MSCQVLRFERVQSYSNVRTACIELLESRKAELATTCSRIEKTVIAAKAEKTSSDGAWLNPKRRLHTA